ncbi:MAG: hypothetical protein DRO39_00420 [Thermoprotei archaeon]|nr:MAG: hypothetical protein DRO39_00420 [Thermoprotei archaeon]
MPTIELDEFKKLLSQALDSCLRLVYEYNNVAKAFNVYLKPIHVVTKKHNKVYIYVAKYWYRIVKQGNGIKWVYIGSGKPNIPDLPEPPRCAIERIAITVHNNFVDIDNNLLRALRALASNSSSSADTWA